MTVEELAAEEQQRLQRLEAQRLKRLRGPSGDDVGDEDESGAEGDDTVGLGGFAGRRAKRRKREAQGELLPVNPDDTAVLCHIGRAHVWPRPESPSWLCSGLQPLVM